jgi:hypothetical protein
MLEVRLLGGARLVWPDARAALQAAKYALTIGQSVGDGDRAPILNLLSVSDELLPRLSYNGAGHR